MHRYIWENSGIINQAVSSTFRYLRLAIQEPQIEIERFSVVCAFLSDNPDRVSGRWRVKPLLTTRDGLEQFALKFFSERFANVRLSPPQTVPDNAVSLVLQLAQGLTWQDTERIKVEHQWSMAAENLVGSLLERYIASEMEQYGWVWCAGNFVKAVDFVHLQNQTWTALQVKNRSNTENSSSSAIRNGSEIRKWFRIYAKTGETNWLEFPDLMFRQKLSEDGFRRFIEQALGR